MNGAGINSKLVSQSNVLHSLASIESAENSESPKKSNLFEYHNNANNQNCKEDHLSNYKAEYYSNYQNNQYLALANNNNNGYYDSMRGSFQYNFLPPSISPKNTTYSSSPLSSTSTSSASSTSQQLLNQNLPKSGPFPNGLFFIL